MTDQSDDAEFDRAESQSSALIERPTSRGQSLAERVARTFYKLTWRTPLHNMRLTGKLPLRLLAVPEDPLPADQVRGQALRMGMFRHQGLEQPFHNIDYDRLPLPPAMVDYIHRFAWLRDLAAATNRADGAPIAAAITEQWFSGNSKMVREPGWRVDNSAWRMLNMARGKYWADLGNTPGHLQHWNSKHFVALIARHMDIVAVAKPIPWTFVLCRQRSE